MDSPKFSQFNITSTPYKTVNKQEIPAYVFIPKDVKSGPRPIIVRFHGGFFIAGDAIYPDWAAQWSLDYTLKHSAILIAPNYRLFPESKGTEILSDIRDLWTWLEKDLPAYLKSIGSDVTPDYSKVLSYGESAGGYLAIQSGLMRPDFIKTIIAAYPMTYIDSPWYCAPSSAEFPKSPMGAPHIPKEAFLGFAAGLEKGKIFTGVAPPERMHLCLAAVQNGLFGLLGDEEELFPARVLEKTNKDVKVPYFFAFHGEQDSAVPCAETVKFVETWKGKFGEESAVVATIDGDHGCDATSTLEDEWLKAGLTGVTKAWIG
ncbi:hypothetical protein G7Y89_g6673 [Cudoniella acicularis]|uniref:Alpha/beta hydrolase fold-3 domain-containing protein n=1 Tax=Cudoniella acicularis TaxID=354080 RepID=A0A8H4W5A0_9HELO|nr:hypothetical protein G7Y89_g6673 [Cudoniella acicularis]